MNKWKVSFFVCLLTLVGSNLFWLYMAIDFGITYNYQQVSYDENHEAVEALGSLIVKGAKDYSQKDMLHLLRQAKPSAFIVEEQNSISFDGIHFIFENGKLVDVNG